VTAETMLATKRLSVVPTMKCTLRCRLCSNHIPDFKNPPSASYEEIIADIDALFKLFDKIEWLQFVGGEIFLHKDLARVYKYCQKYKSQFDTLIVETNATITPREEEIIALAEYGENAKIMISDYGDLSAKKAEYINAAEENHIPYVLKKYYGDDQHYGGWIENTGLRDYGESDEDVARLAAGCAQVRLENMHCFRGKLHRCSNSLFMTELGILEPNKRDCLNLYDNTLTLDEKRAVILDFYKTPRKSCRFCTWKNGETAPRFSAAAQLN
jgi:MoaA/NifB/PqqE/SkfB family radical SAM enzyme